MGDQPQSPEEASETTADIHIQPGRYQHYKGAFYEVIATARHSETEELMVVYRCLYGDHSLWVRPLGMFMEQVVVAGQEMPRFTPCNKGV